MLGSRSDTIKGEGSERGKVPIGAPTATKRRNAGVKEIEMHLYFVPKFILVSILFVQALLVVNEDIFTYERRNQF